MKKGAVSLPRPGLTALHHVAIKGHAELVPLLVQRGATIDRRSSYDDTPLHFAAAWGHCGAAAALLHAGADPRLLDGDGYCIVVPITRSLRATSSLGADPRLLDGDGDTPLGAALNEEQHEVVRLLQRRAESDARR